MSKNSSCTCCTCEPCPKAMVCSNQVTNSGFKEFIPIPKGVTKNDIHLDVTDNSYRISGKATLTCDENEAIFHAIEFERRFKKAISNVELKEENGHPYVEGKFE